MKKGEFKALKQNNSLNEIFNPANSEIVLIEKNERDMSVSNIFAVKTYFKSSNVFQCISVIFREWMSLKKSSWKA